jgi:hypothetical protein
VKFGITVQELVEKLRVFPPNAEVYMDVGDEYHDIERVIGEYDEVDGGEVRFVRLDPYK